MNERLTFKYGNTYFMYVYFLSIKRNLKQMITIIVVIYSIINLCGGQTVYTLLNKNKC